MKHFQKLIFGSIVCVLFASWVIFVSSCKQETRSAENTTSTEPEKEEAVIFEKSLVQEGEVYPVEVEIKIYDAPQLPLGDYYRKETQLENAEHLNTIRLEVNSNCHHDLDEHMMKGEIELRMAENNNLFEL